VIFESGADPFSIEGCNASGRLVVSITPYSYMCFALQFQPMQRGKYQRPLTVLASTVLGDPSESDQHAIVDVFGICSVPTLDGLPADGDLHFGNVEEGRTRRFMLAVYNSDISTSTVTMEVDVRRAA